MPGNQLTLVVFGVSDISNLSDTWVSFAILQPLSSEALLFVLGSFGVREGVGAQGFILDKLPTQAVQWVLLVQLLPSGGCPGCVSFPVTVVVKWRWLAQYPAECCVAPLQVGRGRCRSQPPLAAGREAVLLETGLGHTGDRAGSRKCGIFFSCSGWCVGKSKPLHLL